MPSNDLYGFDLEKMFELVAVHNSQDLEAVLMKDRYYSSLHVLAVRFLEGVEVSLKVVTFVARHLDAGRPTAGGGNHVRPVATFRHCSSEKGRGVDCVSGLVSVTIPPLLVYSSRDLQQLDDFVDSILFASLVHTDALVPEPIQALAPVL